MAKMYDAEPKIAATDAKKTRIVDLFGLTGCHHGILLVYCQIVTIEKKKCA